jgi:hypothetical protein
MIFIAYAALSQQFFATFTSVMVDRNEQVLILQVSFARQQFSEERCYGIVGELVLCFLQALIVSHVVHEKVARTSLFNITVWIVYKYYV